MSAGKHVRKLSRKERKAQATQAKVDVLHYAAETTRGDESDWEWYEPLCGAIGNATLALDWAAVTCESCNAYGDAL